MGAYNLDVSEIVSIFKESLNIQPLSKTVSAIFGNERYRAKVNYAPSFQRNYVWDNSKASYFIESVLLGTEIPPIVLFKDAGKYEVIDGRQRYETLLRFVDGSLALDSHGMKRLGDLAGYHYADLPQEVRESFDDTKLRLLTFSVVNEPSMTGSQKDKVKREIFNRYNSGITSLKREEVERAEFYDDPITLYFADKFESDGALLERCEAMFGTSKKKKGPLRDRINALLSKVRTLLAMPFIPVRSYAYGKGKADIVAAFYAAEVSQSSPAVLFDDFCSRVEKIAELQNCFGSSPVLKGNRLVNEVSYWALSIVEKQSELKRTLTMPALAQALLEADDVESIWADIPQAYWDIERTFTLPGSHFDKAVMARYKLIAHCVGRITGIDFSAHLDDKNKFERVIEESRDVGNFDPLHLPKSDPRTESIDDILANVGKNRFLIRPAYQRSEVSDVSKASYLIESVILGIRIPPIFVFKRKDGVFEVVDGQQRLLSIIGFLGRTFIDEHGVESRSRKDGFKLKGLRILKELNGCSFGQIERDWPEYYEQILDFGIDVIETDERHDPSFNPIDLFQRLNSKPMPIKLNSFEMWNSYIDRSIVERAKSIVAENPGEFFRQNDNRMKNEELVTVLAYTAYQAKHDGSSVRREFTIFVRDNKLSVRAKDMKKVTRVLDSASDSDVEGFLSAMNRVDDFLEKLKVLTGSHFNELRPLISADSGVRTRGTTNQESYLLWMLLEKAGMNGLMAHKTEVLEKVRASFLMAKAEEFQPESISFVEKGAKRISEICSH